MTLHIYEMLKRFAPLDKSFHMPGHKANGEFLKYFPGAATDITELDYSDNLACPSGAIKKAQEDIARITGAERCFILTDGSTSGVMSMMFAVKDFGKKIIVFSNSHKSVWNACRLFGLEPVIACGKIKDGVCLPPTAEDIARLAADGDVCGMVATSPDYYGNIADLKGYKSALGDKFLLVDGAHGAHLCFEKDRKGYAGVYADIWVDGAHKTLPTLTQGALLNVKHTKLLKGAEEGLSVFRTSSPSYPVMASVEFGYKYLYDNPGLISNAGAAAKEFKSGLCFNVYPSDDPMKVAVDFGGAGIDANAAAAELEKRGFYAEMCDGRYILFYLSPMTERESLQRLKAAVNSLKDKFCGTYSPRAVPERQLGGKGFLSACRAECEYIDLKDAEGRVCARSAGLNPPCIPVVLAGEKITACDMEILLGAHGAFGLVNGKIAVIKNGNTP